MQRIYLILLLFSAGMFAQKTDAWLTAEAEMIRWHLYKKQQKEIPATPIDRAGKLFAIGRCYEYLNREDLALKYYLLSKKGF